MGKRGFDARVNVYEVNWARTRGGQNAKVIALGKQGIERSQSIRIWVVSARNIRLGAKARSERNGWDAIARFRGARPGFKVRRADRALLPDTSRFVRPPG